MFNHSMIVTDHDMVSVFLIWIHTFTKNKIINEKDLNLNVAKGNKYESGKKGEAYPEKTHWWLGIYRQTHMRQRRFYLNEQI